MSVGGILAGTHVEVCGVERMDDGDLLVALITDPPTWVCMRAGSEADETERAYSQSHRLSIPMPPQSVLMMERPSDV